MPTLKLTDGTTTIDFTPSGNYRLISGGYTPKINGLRVESLGGRGIYADVEETISFEIWDTTAAACYSRLNTLTKLLLQANRFARGESVAAVKVQYSPDSASVSSSVSPLEAQLIGTPDSNPSGIALAQSFDQAGYQYAIQDIEITIRRGVWLQGSETQLVGEEPNGEVMQFTFATNVDYMSPTDVSLVGHVIGYGIPALFLVLGSGSTSIQALNAANSTGSPGGIGGWSYVNDAANVPRNTNVLRYQPSDTVERYPGRYTTASLTEGRRYTILVSCRNNSASTSFSVRAGIMYPHPNVLPAEYTESRTVGPYSGSAAPGYISLGSFVAPTTDPAANIILHATASAASGSIDFDSIIVVEADNACIVQFNNPVKFYSTSSHWEYTYIENRFLDGLTMRVRGYVIAYSEDTIETRNGGDMLSLGTDVRAILLGTRGTAWRQTYDGGGVTDITISLTRTRVHLSPE